MVKTVLLFGLLVAVVLFYIFIQWTKSAEEFDFDELTDHFEAVDKRDLHILSEQAICCVCRDIRKDDGWCGAFWTLLGPCLKAPTRQSWVRCKAISVDGESSCTKLMVCD